MRRKSTLMLITAALITFTSWFSSHVSAGSIVAWGYNNECQRNVPSGNDFVAIAGGCWHALALKADGSLVAWGRNAERQCNVPVGNDFVAIACGRNHSLAIKSDGSLVAWGHNWAGQCNVPQGNDFVAISGMCDTSIALRSDGSMVVWGQFASYPPPQEKDFASIAGGYNHGLALKTDGSLAAWGSNAYGQCDVPPGNDFTAISAGEYYLSLALSSDGSLRAWGYQSVSGQCDVPLGNDFTAVAAGSDFGLALRRDGSLSAWGRNMEHQCDVPFGNCFYAIAAGGLTSYALSTGSYDETIQAAIDDANDGDTIVVPPGRYSGFGNCDIDFQGKAIVLRSQDPNDANVVAATIIDCNGTAADPHRAFYFHSSEDADSILDGFTIINGYGPNEPFSTTEYSAGGAVYCKNSSPTIRNCVFANNYCAYWGGAVHCDYSRAAFSHCTFRDNVSGDTGGGLYNRISSITVSNCLFSDNSAAAGGGIYNIDGASTVTNTLFVGNSAALAGGGLRNKRVNSTITNCIFFDNYAPAGGAIHNVLSEGTAITNCILWDNPDTEIEGDAEVSYCDVQGGWLGEGNIDSDPCFADAGSGDYHLKSQAGRWDSNSQTWVVHDVTSPCIDGGDPSSSIGWEPYPNGGITNMGIHGGTEEASKSYFGVPACGKPIAGDANGDCRVDFKDFMIMALHWCEDNNP